MKSNFDFLNKDFPVLANFGRLAEDYCYSDSNSALMKIGMIGETIINLMFTYDRVPFPAENTAVKRIDTLFREGLLTQDLVDIFHALRKTRNRAVHENYTSVPQAKTLLQMAYSLCEWFMQTYGDWGYLPKPFVMPEEQPAIVSNKEAEETEADIKIGVSGNYSIANGHSVLYVVVNGIVKSVFIRCVNIYLRALGNDRILMFSGRYCLTAS